VGTRRRRNSRKTASFKTEPRAFQVSLTCAGDAREVLGGRLRHSKRHPAPLSHVRPCTYNVRPCTYNVVRTSSSHLYLQRCAHLLQSPVPTTLCAPPPVTYPYLLAASVLIRCVACTCALGRRQALAEGPTANARGRGRREEPDSTTGDSLKHVGHGVQEQPLHLTRWSKLVRRRWACTRQVRDMIKQGSVINMMKQGSVIIQQASVIIQQKSISCRVAPEQQACRAPTEGPRTVSEMRTKGGERPRDDREW
jgi:hypothetical protein